MTQGHKAPLWLTPEQRKLHDGMMEFFGDKGFGDLAGAELSSFVSQTVMTSASEERFGHGDPNLLSALIMGQRGPRHDPHR